MFKKNNYNFTWPKKKQKLEIKLVQFVINNN